MTTPRVPQSAPEHAAPPADVAADLWVSVGPAVVIRGLGAKLPRVSGRVVALAVHAQGQRAYAGTALGGVWYSGDEGAHWTSLDFYSSALDAGGVRRHADALTVGAIAVEWGATAADDVVYVGSGEHPALGAERSTTFAASGIRRAVGPVVAIMPAAAPVVGPAAADSWRVEAADLEGLAVNEFAVQSTANPGVMWAATSQGLYRRTPGAPPHWDLVDTTLAGVPSSVVVVPGAAAGQFIVYVAYVGGAIARSANGGVDWQAINLPAFPLAEVVPDTTIGRVRLVRGQIANHDVVYVLADGPRLWRLDGGGARIVVGLPRALSESDPETLKPYTLALAVHPTNEDVITIGGQTVGFPSADRRQAALFQGTVAAIGAQLTFQPPAAINGAPAGWVGGGVPPGVQAIQWVAPVVPSHVWIGGDGGVFRSIDAGNANSYVERNTGLAAIEVTSFAQAADSDGVMIAGTRGTGLIRRRSGETWDVVRHGQVGSVAIDPGNPRRFYAQHTAARWPQSAWWQSTDGGATIADLEYQSRTPDGLAPAVQRRWDDARRQEQEASALFSRMGLFAIRGGRQGTRRALGTNRVWYTDDERQFAVSQLPRGSLASGWVTLPSLTDPYDATRPGAPLASQDVLDSAVLAVEWGAEDRLYVLTETSVYFFEKNPDGTWNAPVQLYDAVAVQRDQKFKTPAGQIPWELPRISLAVHQVHNGRGTLYVGTTGQANMHHCWWFDGNDRWLDTGFAIDTPVRAMVVDPTQQQVVYIATERGVYRGTGNFPPGADPTWNWVLYSDGLPVAACTDLAIYSPQGAGRRLLRAALAGRGIWEVQLDGVQQRAEIYLRSHAVDTRRQPIPTGGARDPFCAALVQLPLDASPDIRIWRSAGTPPPEPLDYAVTPLSDEFDIWRLLSGLRAAGDDVDPKEGWIGTTGAAIAHRLVTLFPVPPAPSDEAFWNRLLQDNPLPHDRTPLDHADLVMHMRDEPDRWPKGFRTSCVTGDAATRIFVTVHSRHWRPIVDNTVAIVLLKAEFGRHRSLAGTPPLPAGWGNNLFADRLVNPWPAGNPAWLAGTGWEYADTAHPFQWITGPFDPHNPQVVVFDVTLNNATDGWNKPGLLLLAVAVVDGDFGTLPATTDVAEIVRTDRRVVARSVRRANIYKDRVRSSGMDISAYPTDAVMDRAWAGTNIVWTGSYFPSPRVQPLLGDAGGGGHSRLAANDPWQPAWAHLFPEWGVAHIYWGQQAGSAGTGPYVQTPPPAVPPNRNRDLGIANANDAADQAENLIPPAAPGGPLSLPKGAAIYLDFESGGALTNAVWGAVSVEYCTAFFHRLAERGYRPALYSQGATARRLREETPGVFGWSVRYDAIPANAWRVRRGQLVLDTTPAVNNFDVDALMRQWIQENPGAGVVLPPILNETGAVVPNPIHPLFRPDFDVTLIHDPAFPERRNRPARIRGGRVAAVPGPATQTVIYTTRRGRPRRALVAGAVTIEFPETLTDDTVKFQWNPFSPLAALRLDPPVAGADPTDVLLGVGFAEREGTEAWRVQMLSHRVTAAGATTAPWLHETVPDSGFFLDPLHGVAALTRADRSIDVFAIITRSARFGDTGELAVAHWTPDTATWSTISPLAGATVRRTNRPTAISRAVGVADAWWINDAGRLATAASADPAHPELWALAAAPISDPTVEIHPFANIAAVARDANRIDVFVLGRLAAAGGPWRLYNIWWINPGGWIAANARVADDGTVPFEPLSSIAACQRDAGFLEVFTVGLDDGALYVTTLDVVADTWAGPVRVGAAPAHLDRIALVDSASSHGGADVQIVLTSRDGNLWTTTWDAGAGAYGPLVTLAAVFPL
jgi:hypothetical protein